MTPSSPILLVYGSGPGQPAVPTALVRALTGLAALWAVGYDRLDGQARFLDRAGLAAAFGPDSGLAPHRFCHRVNARFGDLLDAPDRTWLVLPDRPFREPDGNAIFARLLTQAHSYGLGVVGLWTGQAAPAGNESGYADWLCGLTRCDRIVDLDGGSAQAALGPGLAGRIVSWRPDDPGALLAAFSAVADERAAVAAAVLALVTEACDHPRPGRVMRGGWCRVCGRLEDLRDVAPVAPGDNPPLLVAVSRPFGRDDLDLEDLRRLAGASVLILPDTACRQALIEAAEACALDVPLPEAVFTPEQAGSAGRAALALTWMRRRATAVAGREARYRAALAAVKPGRDPGRSEDTLAVIVSTFNRAPFAAANVAWLLGRIEAEKLPVRCLVYDNASTDDTRDRLRRFQGHPGFAYLRSPANTGLLGNLRSCATLFAARYVWITGDDDFLMPGALTRTLDAIRDHPGLPLLVHNFGVYHRERLTAADTPLRLQSRLHWLAPQPSPSGLYPVRVIAGEHDNLFTAFYPLVWRSDILAGCFNHPFDGPFFRNLTECIPTTRYLLEELARTEAYWFAELGTAGNAHNSWTRHRPRWHLRIMPRALALARAAGVSPHKLWSWTGAHAGLFAEAVDLALAADTPAWLRAPEDFDFASVFFRRPVAVAAGLRLGEGGTPRSVSLGETGGAGDYDLFA